MEAYLIIGILLAIITGMLIALNITLRWIQKSNDIADNSEIPRYFGSVNVIKTEHRPGSPDLKKMKNQKRPEILKKRLEAAVSEQAREDAVLYGTPVPEDRIDNGKH